MWRSLIDTGFFGLLRVSALHLTRQDISFRLDRKIMYQSTTSKLAKQTYLSSERPLLAITLCVLLVDLLMAHCLFFFKRYFIIAQNVVTFLHIMSLYSGVANINTHSFLMGSALASSSAGASDSINK